MGKAKLKAVKPKSANEKLDIEELAARARLGRQQKCYDEIKDTLAKYRCELQIVVTIGNQQVPLHQVLSFPGLVQVRAL